MTNPSGKRGLIDRKAATVNALARAVSGVMKPASSMRSNAIRCPSGPTIATEMGTPISPAFSVTALMNSRHSAALSLTMCNLLRVEQLFARDARGPDDVGPCAGVAGDVASALLRAGLDDFDALGAEQVLDILLVERGMRGGLDLRNHIGRRTRRHEEAEPHRAFKVLEAKLLDCRQIGR